MAPRVLVTEFGAHFFYGMGRVGVLRHALEPFVECGEVLIAQVFEANVLCAGAGGTDELVEFDLYGFAVAILRVLDQKHHQKGDDSSAGVDNKLPGVRKSEQGPGNTPDYDDSNRAQEDAGRTGEIGDSCRCPTKRFFHSGVSIALFLCF